MRVAKLLVYSFSVITCIAFPPSSAACPDRGNCASCEFGYKLDPRTNCLTCDCLPSPCETSLCDMGTACQVQDIPTCTQQPCAKHAVCIVPLPPSRCGFAPPDETVTNDLRQGCDIYCKYGYKLDRNNVNGHGPNCTICGACVEHPCLYVNCSYPDVCTLKETQCPDAVCPQQATCVTPHADCSMQSCGCQYGSEYDLHGCATCQCIDNPCWGIFCTDNGFNQECKLQDQPCLSTPPCQQRAVCAGNAVCPEFVCNLDCAYGLDYNYDSNGCRICECRPNPCEPGNNRCGKLEECTIVRPYCGPVHGWHVCPPPYANCSNTMTTTTDWQASTSKVATSTPDTPTTTPTTPTTPTTTPPTTTTTCNSGQPANTTVNTAMSVTTTATPATTTGLTPIVDPPAECPPTYGPNNSCNNTCVQSAQTCCYCEERASVVFGFTQTCACCPKNSKCCNYNYFNPPSIGTVPLCCPTGYDCPAQPGGTCNLVTLKPGSSISVKTTPTKGKILCSTCNKHAV